MMASHNAVRTMTPEQQQLVADNVGFAVSYVKKYRYCCNNMIEFDDIVQQGYLGLCKAAKRYRPGGEAKFITYAVFWVRKEVNMFLDEHHACVRLPKSRHKITVECEHCEHLYEAQGLEFTCPACFYQQYRYLFEVSRDTSNLADQTGYTDSLAIVTSDRDYIERLMQGLSDRDKHILRLRHYQNLKLREVGEELDLSRERVRQLLAGSMKHLQKKAKK